MEETKNTTIVTIVENKAVISAIVKVKLTTHGSLVSLSPEVRFRKDIPVFSRHVAEIVGDIRYSDVLMNMKKIVFK